jgi:Fic family protein
VSPQELKTGARVALDSAPIERSNLLRYLINDDEMSCDQYVSLAGCSPATATKRFKQMIRLGIAEKIARPGSTKPYYNIKLSHDYTWLLEGRLRQYLPPTPTR